jgi:hypothetical protein
MTYSALAARCAGHGEGVATLGTDELAVANAPPVTPKTLICFRR